jgi:hypothetical protein
MLSSNIPVELGLGRKVEDESWDSHELGRSRLSEGSRVLEFEGEGSERLCFEVDT